MGFFQDLFGAKKMDQELPPNLIPQGLVGYEDLLKRYKTMPMGYGADFVSRATNPYIKSREARFDEIERPDIESTYSSRGLGRSSLVAQDIGKAQTQKERDINELLSEAYLTNIQQKKADEARQQQGLFNLAQAETGQKNIYGQSEQDRAAVQRGIRQYNANADTNFARGVTGAGLTAATMIGAPLLAAAAPALATVPAVGGALSSGASGLSTILSDMNEQQNYSPLGVLFQNAGMDNNSIISLLKSLIKQ